MPYRTIAVVGFERAIERRVDWEIATGRYVPCKTSPSVKSEDYDLTQDHLMRMIVPLYSDDCLIFLIMNTMRIGDRYLYFREIDEMLGLPKGYSNPRYRRAKNRLYRQYKSIVFGANEGRFMDIFINAHAENVLNEIFESNNVRHVL